MDMKVSVCIGATRGNTLQAAIDAIQRQRWTDWELIVVGQGSDVTVRHITETAATRDPRIRYIHTPGRGVSRARNAAIAQCTGDIIAITDDDCVPEFDWLEVIVQSFEDDGSLGAVGGSVVAPPPARQGPAVCPTCTLTTERLYVPAGPVRQPPPGWDLISANLSMRRQVFERVGPFDEFLGPGTEFPAADDVDYRLRMEALDIPMLATPRSQVVHNGYRYGAKAIYRHRMNYVAGDGALAAKLTLLGDPRGKQWRAQMLRVDALKWYRTRHVAELPGNLLRLAGFLWAYYGCMARYTVDACRGVLQPKGA
jgi:glycosyltransferase involved in cell wall biosynthesis